MSHRPRRARALGRFFGIIGAALLVASPFAVYFALLGSAAEGPPSWPAPVAIAATTSGAPSELALVQPEGSPRIVLFPPEVLLEVPETGRVRAATAFRIGGIELVASGLEAFAGPVPYWAEGGGVSALEALDDDFRGNLGENAGEVRRILSNALAGSALVIVAPGEWSEEGGIRTFLPDIPELLAELRVDAPEQSPPATPTPLGSPSPLTSPSPSPTALDPADVSVEVLNAGAPSGSAGRTADALRAEGFTIAFVGDYAGPQVSRTEIYFRQNEEAGEAVASVIGGGVTAQPLREGLGTEADVLVLVGPAP